MTADWHRHVSEREPSSQHGDPADPPGYEDCVPCSGVMAANGMTLGAIPATLAEAEALRADAGVGPGGGMTTAQLNAGLGKRYGFTMPVVATPTIPPEHVATISGRLSNFPAGHRLRRWDPTYTGGHRVMVYRDGAGAYLWADPLAPNLVGGKPWRGEVVTEAEVRTFAGTRVGHTVAPVGEQAVTVNPTTHRPVAFCDVAAGGTVYAAATGTAVLTSTAGTPFTNWPGGTGLQLYCVPASGSGRSGILIDRQGGAGESLAIGWVGSALVSNIRAKVDATPYGPADIEAARLKGRDEEYQYQAAWARVALADRP